MRMIADSESARESRARRPHFPPRGREKWYNTNVVRATERPYRSGTGFTAHPAIALTALHHCKHDVLRKYWTYFKSERDVCELCVLRGAFSYPCIRFRPVQGFLRVHGEGNVRPLFHGLKDKGAHEMKALKMSSPRCPRCGSNEHVYLVSTFTKTGTVIGAAAGVAGTVGGAGTGAAVGAACLSVVPVVGTVIPRAGRNPFEDQASKVAGTATLY